MKLIPNWKPIAARSHSMWAQYLAAIVLIAPELFYWLFGFQILAPRVVWFLAAGLVIYGIVGRLKDQGIDT